MSTHRPNTVYRYLSEACDTLQDALDQSVESDLAINYDGAPSLAEIISALREATVTPAIDPGPRPIHGYTITGMPPGYIIPAERRTPGVLDDPAHVWRGWAMTDLDLPRTHRYGVLDDDHAVLRPGHRV